MPIAAGDILRKYTTKVGTAGNQNVGTADGSLGKYISTTAWADAVANNLFDDITGDENAASDVEYRCEGVHNNHATLQWQAIRAWISAEVAGGASVAIGVDPAAAAPVGQAAAQFAEIVDENTAPAGVAFSAPTTKATGVDMGSIDAGSVRGLWWRRSAANSAALNNDGATVTTEGDTAA